MQNEDSKRIFTEVIKRQIAILGPDITLAKVKNVPGIEIDSTGAVIAISGDPQALLSQLINQFVELSGLIVKKTMESILMSHPDGLAILSGLPASSPPVQAPLVQQVQVPQPQPQPPEAVQNDQEVIAANKDIEDLNKMLNNINK